MKPVNPLRWFFTRRFPALIWLSIRRALDSNMTQVASSLTFTTVLSIVPVLSVVLAVLTASPLFDSFRVALEAYFLKNLMPAAVAQTVFNYLNLFAAKASRVSLVGACILLVVSVMTLSTIENAFNQIWRAKIKRSLKQRIVVYWAILTLGPLLIGVSLRVSAYLFTTTASSPGFFANLLYFLLSLGLSTAFFAALYKIVPSRAIAWRDAWWGGLLAAFAFECAKRLFAVYISRFPNYTVIYGALAAIPIFLVWIYCCWLIVLVGAIFTAILPIEKYERWNRQAKPGTIFLDAIAVLKILLMQRAQTESASVSLDALRQETKIGYDELENLLLQMAEAEWVARLKSEQPSAKKIPQAKERWILLANPAALSLAEVYRFFVLDAGIDDPLEKQLEQAIDQGLAESLESYFLRSQAQGGVGST